MPWKVRCKLDLRMMFVSAVKSGKWGLSEVCRQFTISRKTGYKWLARYEAEGEAGLQERSCRPLKIHYSTDPVVRDSLIAERKAHPYWGARKLCERLRWEGIKPPPERTANRILRRQGLVEVRRVSLEEPRRFESLQPNDLWQVDHKKAIHGGWFSRAVPFLVVDDSTRYLIELRALPDKGTISTWNVLWNIFGELGLPVAILSDNDFVFHGPTGPSQIEVRLMRLGINMLHGRPYHPQTQGKVERLNETLDTELLRNASFRQSQEIQPGFDSFRHRYNFERPHEAIGMEVPGALYRMSERHRPDVLPEVEYPNGAVLRKVQKDGWISWKGYAISVGVGLFGQSVEVRETAGEIEVYYGRYRILGHSLNEETTRRIDKVGGRRKFTNLKGNIVQAKAPTTTSPEENV